MISNDFYKIVDKNADAMIVLDLDGVIRYVNPAGMALFNMAEDEMVDKLLGFPLVLHEPVDMYVLREFRDFIAVEMRMVDVEWKGEPSYLVSLRDVTWRVKYEEELSRSRDELDALVQTRTMELLEDDRNLNEEVEERRAAVEELHREIERREQIEHSLEEARNQAELYLDLMAHDIRNLNQIGIGYLELMAGSSDLDEDQRAAEKTTGGHDQHVTAHQQHQKLKDITTYEITNKSQKPVNLGDLLLDMKRQYSEANNRDIMINIDMPRICFVTANDLLEEVFTNLLDNAIKHSNPEKSLTIDINVKRIKEKQKSYYRCTVDDNGPGIPDYLKDKIFTRFQRGNTKAHGKGLGLYLVKTLVESYHGKVWVEDHVSGDHKKGTRFVVMLPAVEK